MFWGLAGAWSGTFSVAWTVLTPAWFLRDLQTMAPSTTTSSSATHTRRAGVASNLRQFPSQTSPAPLFIGSAVPGAALVSAGTSAIAGGSKGGAVRSEGGVVRSKGGAVRSTGGALTGSSTAVSSAGSSLPIVGGSSSTGASVRDRLRRSLSSSSVNPASSRPASDLASVSVCTGSTTTQQVRQPWSLPSGAAPAVPSRQASPVPARLPQPAALPLPTGWAPGWR